MEVFRFRCVGEFEKDGEQVRCEHIHSFSFEWIRELVREGGYPWRCPQCACWQRARVFLPFSTPLEEEE